MERKVDKDRVREVNSVAVLIQSVTVESQAVDKARDEKISLAVFKAQGKGLQALGWQPYVGEVKTDDKG